jgi:hypothetical protein
MMNRKRIYTGTVVFLALVFTACQMAGPETGEVSGGKAAVHVRITTSGIQGRTVLPEGELAQVTGWELLGGKGTDAESLITNFPDAGGGTIYLDPGAWNFTLKGYRDKDLILAGDLREQTISLEGPNELYFTVSPVLEGEGSFKIVIELPGGVRDNGS